MHFCMHNVRVETKRAAWHEAADGRTSSNLWTDMDMTLTPGCVISRLKLNRKGMGNEWPKDYGGMD